MKLALLLVIFCMPLLLNAQSKTDKGIHFEEGLTWNQIKAKAKGENKYIFVDCFATWCGPCKKMDKDIYPNDTVGNYVNEHFISVRLQMDTSKNDNEDIKKWYAFAHTAQEQYKVHSFPTYLFFSPDGNLVHEDVGFKNGKDFVALTVDAMNLQLQYIPMAERYQQGTLEYQKMPLFAKMAMRLQEKDLAFRIARDYMHDYLDKLSEEEFCAKENIYFLGSFLGIITSKDRFLNVCLRNSARIDAVTRIGYSKEIVDYIIYKEEIAPVFEAAKKNTKIPDWNQLEKTISGKYGGDYAGRNMVEKKPPFYWSIKDWKNYTKSLVQEIEYTGIDNIEPGVRGAGYINEIIWPVFLYSDNKEELSKALSWSELSVKWDSTSSNVPGNMDTRANLLYKLGKREEALTLEGKAALMAPHDKAVQLNFAKMKAGQPTWWMPKRKP